MSPSDVVIQPAAGARPARIADVVGPPPHDPESTVTAEVVWRDDDSRQVVGTTSPMVRTREGSIAYCLAVDPTAVRERYGDRPDRVLAALLAGRPPTDQSAASRLVKEQLRTYLEKAVVRKAFEAVGTWPGVRRTGEGAKAQLEVHPRWADPFSDEADLPPVEVEQPGSSSDRGDGGPSDAAPAHVADEAAAPTPFQRLERLGKQPDAEPVEVAKVVTTVFHASGDAETARTVAWLAAWKRRRELSLDLLLSTVARTGTLEAAKRQRTRTALLETVAEMVDRGTADLTPSQLDALRGAFTKEVYAESSSRRRLLVALAARPGISLDDSAWWAGLTLPDVDDLARASSGRAVRSRRVLDTTVRPLVERAAAEARTRTQVADLLGLAPALAELVPPSALAQAMARAATTDAVMSTWYPVLSHAAEREASAAETARWREAAGAAEQRAREATALAAESDQRLARLQRLLREAQQQTVEATDAERRQARIDVTRAAAQLVLVVEDGWEAHSRDEVVAELITRLATIDVVALGRRGDRADFDPRDHEVVGDVPEPGAPVEVIRTGFGWRSGGEDVVLIKCLTTSAM